MLPMSATGLVVWAKSCVQERCANFTQAYIHLARSLAELRRFDETKSALAVADQLGTETRDVRVSRAWLNRLEASGR